MKAELNSSPMAVLLIGTADTKGREMAYLRRRLEDFGLDVVAMDVGVTAASGPEFAVSSDQVFAAVGTTREAVARVRDRGQAVTLAARGAALLAQRLHAEGQIGAVIALGGSAGTTIGTAAMRALPFGLPKLMVSTVASGNVRPYVGPKDILMYHSVADLSGLNRITRRVLDQAAGALAGMVQRSSVGLGGVGDDGGLADRPLITASMFGVTTPCVQECQRLAEAAGYEVLTFHAVGSGGEAMESLIRDGLVAGVLDITTTELADELVGGILSAGPDRLTAAAARGVPQVVSVGALDMVNFGPRATVPEKFADRHFYQHNAAVTLMRTTAAECHALGTEIARKVSAATGPAAILLPARGISALDSAGGAFEDAAARAALFDAIRANVGPHVRVEVHDRHINDPAFAAACVATLLELCARLK